MRSTLRAWGVVASPLERRGEGSFRFYAGKLALERERDAEIPDIFDIWAAGMWKEAFLAMGCVSGLQSRGRVFILYFFLFGVTSFVV